jgi:hypothetical protein
MPSIATAPIYGERETLTVRMDSDLSAKAGYAVDFDGTDDNVVNLVEDGATQAYILEEGTDGSATESVGVIVVSGRTTAKTAGVVNAGDPLVPTTAGALIKATVDTEYICAVALENGASGDIIQVQAVQGTLSV